MIKRWLKHKPELMSFLERSGQCAFQSAALAGRSFSQMTPEDMAGFYDRSHSLWGTSAEEFALLRKVGPPGSISLGEAIGLVANGADADLVVLVPYQDGGVIALCSEKWEAIIGGSPADWWEPVSGLRPAPCS